MKRTKIVLAVVGLAIIASYSYDFYLKHRVGVLFREVRAREQIHIPRQIRIALTDGTADGAAKGATWLEQQLGTRQGDLAALYILNSLSADSLAPLPYYRNQGVCGDGAKWNRYRRHIRAMQQHLESVDQTIQRYFADQHKPSLHPLPKVDWANLTDIQSKALSCIETKNIGFLMVLSDGIGDAGFVVQTCPSLPYRVKLARVGQVYDLKASAAPLTSIISYELTGTQAGLSPDRVARLSFDTGDADRDGLAGISYLQFETRFMPISEVLATRPSAPPWGDLLTVPQASTRPPAP
jgi:hypothetical protein